VNKRNAEGIGGFWLENLSHTQGETVDSALAGMPGARLNFENAPTETVGASCMTGCCPASAGPSLIAATDQAGITVLCACEKAL
jgi:hypothetical protein